MKTQNEYEKLFENFLDLTEFTLIKHKDGWGLYDRQGANLGNISDDRFENAAEIFDRMDIYINDYFFNDIEVNILEEDETWDNIEDLIGFLGAKLDSDLSEDMRQTIEYEYNILCMIAHYAGEIDLENVYYETEEE